MSEVGAGKKRVRDAMEELDAPKSSGSITEGTVRTRLPTEEFHSYLMRDSELEGHAAANDPSLRRPWSPPSTNNKLPELEKLFDGVHIVTIEECRRVREQLRKKREMREEYKRACSRGEIAVPVVSKRLSSAVSCIWPDHTEACMFYKPQNLMQWAIGSPAFMAPALAQGDAGDAALPGAAAPPRPG